MVSVRRWAERGECERNKVYMHSKCGLACKACEPCASDTDMDCINRNRERLGFMTYDQVELNA